MASTTEWITHITRASLHLEGVGVIHGVTGDEIVKRMVIWTSAFHPEANAACRLLRANGALHPLARREPPVIRTDGLAPRVSASR